ncbi:F-box protein [Carex littledalei]|uniref:F-box protein n=1 Tax=Carex littledalei TaxID=544730 RepID=A0A833Q8V3_9POAL|nr:F-box protein [Carex littledalei]
MANLLQTAEQTEQLSNDVIEEILICVPATSLLRSCQLVCKSWAAKIQEPQFKNEHFRRNNTTNEPLRLLVVKEDQVNSVVFCENPEGVVDPEQRREIWMPRDLGRDGKFGGSCNGLLCTEVRGEITVFNPITRERVSLPRPTDLFTGFGSGINERMYTDLVFHSATGEYKVVLWYYNPLTMDSFTINVYTLGPNSSWRKVINSVVSQPYNAGVNVEDTIYWPYLTEDYDTIISFDLSKEKYDNHLTVVKDGLLLSFDEKKYWRSAISQSGWEHGKLLGITKWKGRLCAITFQRHPEQHSNLKLWTLELINLGERVWHMEQEIQLSGLMINGEVAKLGFQFHHRIQLK